VPKERRKRRKGEDGKKITPSDRIPNEALATEKSQVKKGGEKGEGQRKGRTGGGNATGLGDCRTKIQTKM